MQGCWGALGDEEREVLGWGHGFLLGSICPGCADLGTMHLSPWARAAHGTGVGSLLEGGRGGPPTLTLCCAVTSCVPLSAIPWAVTRQVPLFMEFSRQEYWSGLPGDLSDPGIEPVSLVFPALAGRFFTTRATWEVLSLLMASASAIWGMITSVTWRKVFRGHESLGKPGSS